MFCDSNLTNEQLPAHAMKKALHRSKPWASYWLDRYNNNNNDNNNNKEGIEEGLRDKPKSGRTPHIPLRFRRIRKD